MTNENRQLKFAAARTRRGAPSPELTAEDWVEIYYALEYKLMSPAVDGDDEWVKHIKSILETIGPDGDNMTR